MTTATLILLLLLLLVSLYGIFQFKSSLSEIEVMLEKGQKLREEKMLGLEKQLDNIKSNFNELLQSDQWDKLNSNLTHLTSVFEQLNTDDYRVWQDAIKKETDDKAKLDLLESAAERFTNKIEIIKRIREILEPLANKSENLLVRREALMRLRKHANNFSEKCDFENFAYARDFQNNVIESMESVLKKIDELRETNLSNLLNELESKIKKIKKDPDKNKLLEEVEKIDELIDQNVLTNYPELKNRYEKLSKTLIQILGNEENDGKSILKDLNEKAVKDAKKVMELIKTHSVGNMKDKVFGPDKPVNFNEKKHLLKLTKLLSNKGTNKLLPSTVNYLRTV